MDFRRVPQEVPQDGAGDSGCPYLPLGPATPRRRRLSMAEAGQEIYNPRQKDRIIFKQTARETGGDLLQLEIFTSPNAAPPPDHVHPRQEERFETVSGTLRA